jgi:hypothetical protein
MRTVWRFDIPLEEVKDRGGLFTLTLPLNSRPLHVDVQQRAPHKPSIWVLCDEDEERTVEWEFLLVGTGTQAHEPVASKYLGTFQDMGFVWHIFER